MRLWGKAIEIAENWLLRFRIEGGAKQYRTQEISALTKIWNEGGGSSEDLLTIGNKMLTVHKLFWVIH